MEWTRGQLLEAFSPFSQDDLWRLKRFSRKVGELQESEFAETTTGLEAVLIPGAVYLGGPAFQVSLDGPSDEVVKAVIGDFRQLYTDTNDTSAMRVVNILCASARRKGSSDSAAIIAEFREIKREIKRRKNHDPRGVFLEEGSGGETTEKTPARIISIWLNGEFFHDDRELADELDPEGHMSRQMMRMSLQMAIRDFIAYWGQIRRVIDLLVQREDANGTTACGS